ncbi:unnamed protein product [Arabidopsis lyrata]|uniref:Uncharacterized protein n=1 Tax=Arabidopsis lyrata subsp. lyrata TaxID=81972 RepID=D7LHK3_ARALL|nr:hypothetical protein ARALYDRAFT_344002 [Arabidopsis lyrata subsp. lyrata]CAH8263355.1 unnamed protein product [Arabidopsis lyrata]
MATIDKQLKFAADIQVMVAAEVHFGTKNCKYQMKRYVFKQHNVSCVEVAQHTGVNAIVGRHTFGTFTNQMQTSFSPEQKWVVIMDLFFYRVPEELGQAIGVVGGDQWTTVQITDAAWLVEA